MTPNHCYLIVPTAFKNAFDGHVSGPNVLRVPTTIDGRHVVSVNAVNVFPEVFRDQVDSATFVVSFAWLSPEDFPVTESSIHPQ